MAQHLYSPVYYRPFIVDTHGDVLAQVAGAPDAQINYASSADRDDTHTGPTLATRCKSSSNGMSYNLLMVATWHGKTRLVGGLLDLLEDCFEN